MKAAASLVSLLLTLSRLHCHSAQTTADIDEWNEFG